MKSSDAAGKINITFYKFRVKNNDSYAILYHKHHIDVISLDECKAICAIANCEAPNAHELCPDKCGKY